MQSNADTPSASASSAKRPLRIYSWNVNGLRAVGKKGFLDWLEASDGDVVCLQEARARPEQLPDALRSPLGWRTDIVCADKLGYSGVAVYARQPWERVASRLGEERFDREGRVQELQFGALRVLNVYFPNGNGKDRDNGRVRYKLAFYRRLFDHLKPGLDAGERILVMGDFNTCHRMIDLARPKQNKGTSGFLMSERQELTRWLRAGWVDTWRHFEPRTADRYTWWSQRLGVRARNVGWRLDMIYASPAALPFVRSAAIHDDVMGSDHCPVSVTLDPAVMRR